MVVWLWCGSRGATGIEATFQMKMPVGMRWIILGNQISVFNGLVRLKVGWVGNGEMVRFRKRFIGRRSAEWGRV